MPRTTASDAASNDTALHIAIPYAFADRLYADVWQRAAPGGDRDGERDAASAAQSVGDDAVSRGVAGEGHAGGQPGAELLRAGLCRLRSLLR
eukprot:250674-Rhodomonas_salina.4